MELKLFKCNLRLGLTVVANTRCKSATHSLTVEYIFAFSNISTEPEAIALALSLR